MSGCDIDWPAVGSVGQAIATLLTGFAAVAGAVIVARKQAVIAERQTKILAEQARIEAMKLRHELFDRRVKIYDACREFILWTMGDMLRGEANLWAEIGAARRDARFLFPPSVERAINEFIGKATEVLETTYAMNKEYENKKEFRQEDIDRRHAAVLWLGEQLHNLDEMFGDELKLWKLGEKG